MLIWKTELPADTLDIRELKLPFASTEEAVEHILKVDNQYGMPVCWFQADSDGNGKVKPKKTFVVQGIGTGHEYSDDKCRQVFNKNNYIGTAALMGDTLILHYFLVSKKEYEGLFKWPNDYT